jgi:hypothetical protein
VDIIVPCMYAVYIDISIHVVLSYRLHDPILSE